ncbi:hypothetical protein AVEN_246956-1 [Araneus ventricosus]|uniref:Uncharacterized protein n=1 Tax=Araneus ventricosus TaxID=182803 RepID=A0A4Y2JL60_ARAVE|nr:hypothetical protein AVEN_246956-1 [Araneus ventricosus]
MKNMKSHMDDDEKNRGDHLKVDDKKETPYFSWEARTIQSSKDCNPPPIPIMLPHRGVGGGPGWNGRCTSGVFTPGRVTLGVKVIPLYPAKA